MAEHPKFHFFVDAKQYETDQASVTGAQIKATVSGLNPAYQLFLESHGNDPDRLVSDGETISRS